MPILEFSHSSGVIAAHSSRTTRVILRPLRQGPITFRVFCEIERPTIQDKESPKIENMAGSTYKADPLQCVIRAIASYPTMAVMDVRSWNVYQNSQAIIIISQQYL